MAMRNRRIIFLFIILLSILVCSCDGDEGKSSRQIKDTRWQQYIHTHQKPYREINLLHVLYRSHFTLSPDRRKALYGNYLNMGPDLKTIYLIDMNSPDILKTLEGHIKPQGVQCAAFSSDGKRAVSGGGLDHDTEQARIEGTLSYWDLDSGKLLGHIEHKDALMRKDYLIRSVAYSPAGNKAISGGDDGDILLWDLEKMQALKTFVGHSSGIRRNCLTWSKDGKTFVSGSWDGSIRQWDVQTAKEVAHLQAGYGRVMSLALSPDGKYALSSYLNGPNQPVIFWDLEDQREINRFGIPGNHRQTDQWLHVVSVAFSPDGKTALLGLVFGTVIWWDLNEWRQIAMNRLYEKELTFVAYSADGKSSISVGWDTTQARRNVKVKFWQLPALNKQNQKEHTLK